MNDELTKQRKAATLALAGVRFKSDDQMRDVYAAVEKAIIDAECHGVERAARYAEWDADNWEKMGDSDIAKHYRALASGLRFLSPTKRELDNESLNV